MVKSIPSPISNKCTNITPFFIYFHITFTLYISGSPPLCRHRPRWVRHGNRASVSNWIKFTCSIHLSCAKINVGNSLNCKKCVYQWEVISYYVEFVKTFTVSKWIHLTWFRCCVLEQSPEIRVYVLEIASSTSSWTSSWLPVFCLIWMWVDNPLSRRLVWVNGIITRN